MGDSSDARRWAAASVKAAAQLASQTPATDIPGPTTTQSMRGASPRQVQPNKSTKRLQKEQYIASREQVSARSSVLSRELGSVAAAAKSAAQSKGLPPAQRQQPAKAKPKPAKASAASIAAASASAVLSTPSPGPNTSSSTTAASIAFKTVKPSPRAGHQTSRSVASPTEVPVDGRTSSGTHSNLYAIGGQLLSKLMAPSAEVPPTTDFLTSPNLSIESSGSNMSVDAPGIPDGSELNAAKLSVERQRKAAQPSSTKAAAVPTGEGQDTSKKLANHTYARPDSQASSLAAAVSSVERVHAEIGSVQGLGVIYRRGNPSEDSLEPPVPLTAPSVDARAASHAEEVARSALAAALAARSVAVDTFEKIDNDVSVKKARKSRRQRLYQPSARWSHHVEIPPHKFDPLPPVNHSEVTVSEIISPIPVRQANLSALTIKGDSLPLPVEIERSKSPISSGLSNDGFRRSGEHHRTNVVRSILQTGLENSSSESLVSRPASSGSQRLFPPRRLDSPSSQRGISPSRSREVGDSNSFGFGGSGTAPGVSGSHIQPPPPSSSPSSNSSLFGMLSRRKTTRTPVQAPSTNLKSTMRKEHKSRRFNEDKPWKHHVDMWLVSDKEKKRYEGLWATNKGAHLSYVLQSDDEDETSPSEDESPKRYAFSERDPSEDIHGIIVRDIWRRSRLPDETLERIWNLVDRRHDGTLDRDGFLVGMWLVDQCLYGRKLPNKISDNVWSSVSRLNVKVRVFKDKKDKRMEKKRAKRNEP